MMFFGWVAVCLCGKIELETKIVAYCRVGAIESKENSARLLLAEMLGKGHT